MYMHAPYLTYASDTRLICTKRMKQALILDIRYYFDFLLNDD